MTNQEFVNKYYPYAERINKEYGLKFNPMFWVAQWAIESGNGTNLWTIRGNNVSASNVTNGAQTPIIKSGSRQNYFDNLEQWYKNLTVNILNLGGNSTYSRAGFKEATTIEEAARAIVAGGYTATDRGTYATSISNKANELINTTTLPTGSNTFKEEKTTSTGGGGRSGSYGEAEEEKTDLPSFEAITPYLTFKNVILYFIGLTLLLLIIRFLNKGGQKND